jgi:hypothetical protein
MINQYHENFIDLKGDSLYFIPKSEIESTVGYKNLKPLKDVSIDDNVSFFDEDGNIVYQSTCVGISNDTIRVACFDLNKKVDYVAKITNTNYDNIFDLKKFLLFIYNFSLEFLVFN